MSLPDLTRDQVVGLVCILAGLLVPAVVIALATVRATYAPADVSRLDRLDGVCGCEDGDCWCPKPPLVIVPGPWAEDER